jgi:hypothetical protein
MRAIRGSEAHAALSRRPSGIYTNYQLSPGELWARAYAQFIATESGSVEMLTYLEKVRSGRTIYWAESQWTDADFAPIRAAIRDAFRHLRWMQ